MTRAAILIVAPRQLPLAKRRASVNHPKTRLPLLIQIDAPFSPRLSRHSPQFPFLLELGPDVYPRAALADKGYDSKANRQAARERGFCPAIPYRSNVKDQPKFFPKLLYATRSRIEITVGKAKRFKRIALRCEKTAANFASFLAFVLAIILVKSVHTT